MEITFGSLFAVVVDWLSKIGNAFTSLFLWEFSIGTIRVRFMDMAIGSLIILLAMLFVKKFIPLA